MLTLYHRMFVRAGARLAGAERTRLKEIVQRLASLGTAFGQNVLADEKAWALPLGPDDLAGLPADLVAAAAQAAKERGLDGHVVTLSRSLIVPFLQFSPRRDLRERAFRAWTARGKNGGETDNRAIVAEMLGCARSGRGCSATPTSRISSSSRRWRERPRRSAIS